MEVLYVSKRRCGFLPFRSFAIRAASASSASGRPARSGRRVYNQSQAQAPLPAVALKEAASFVVPVGTFVVVTFGTVHAIY